jgi:hypothetical protein
MEFFRYNFPMSGVMVGNVIPGLGRSVRVSKIANYMSGDRVDVLKGRRGAETNPVVKPLDMNNPHAEGHGFMDKLKRFMSGPSGQGGGDHLMGDMKKAFGMGSGGPKLAEGYEPMAENRQWRRQ